MRSIAIYFLFLIALSFISCEEVVNVDLKTAEPRLVVDANIDWQKGTDGKTQTIKLTTTAGYYDTVIPAATGAIVSVSSSANEVFDFIEDTPGTYVCQSFVPKINEVYTLTIVYQGETYTATETLLATPTIKRVEQRNDGGFTGEDIEIKFFFDDFPNETNYYFAAIKNPKKAIPQYGVLEDRYFQNNEMPIIYSDPDLTSGDVLPSRLYGISKTYFNYMNILLAQTGVTSGGPFTTPPATVRGNIVNQTNFDNYALGYFRLGEMEFLEYTVE